MNIKHGGNKRYTLALMYILILLGSIFQSACFAGLDDWSYDLPNNYRVVRVNSQSVVFGKVENTFDQTIDRYIVAFCYDDSYVGLKRISMDNIEPNKCINIDDFDESDYLYYLIDTERNIQYGPFGESAYNEHCKKLGAIELCNWIDTKNKPEGAD